MEYLYVVVQGGFFWEKGGQGAIDIANKIVNICERNSNIKYAYEMEDSIKEKIEKISKKVYGAENVVYTEKAEEEIRKIEELGYRNLPVCIAKTQYSFSDDQKNLECKEEFDIHIRDIILKSGAGFVVALTGDIMTMPGLPKKPSAENIDIDEYGNIIGIF